jgi:antitoxin (DNA-binding transcriptional repressor) of toxin-antitoxin stability system
VEKPADTDQDLLRHAVDVRELQDHLSRFLTEVKEGKSVVVLEHGHPIGILGPWPHHDPLEDLIRQGRARRSETYTRRRHDPGVEFRGTDREFEDLLGRPRQE